MLVDNYEVKYKAQSPISTVDRIILILNSLNIELEEEWCPISEIGTYSLRVTIKGCKSVGSNGKGMTVEYARASAYAEFMERLQNMRLSPLGQYYQIYKRNSNDFFVFQNEKIMSAEELVKENNSFIQMFMKKRGLADASFEDKVKSLINVQNMDYLLLKQYKKFITIPYYSVKEKKVQNIPYFILSAYYASNGMCAGNTMAEALVQGLSEIMERESNNRILLEKTTLPDIPESFISYFPEIYKMYNQIKSDDKYSLILKDCSFGKPFPVVALIIIEKDTGKYGIKLGAHPNIGIAIERTFTEATQGLKINQFCQKSNLNFENLNVDFQSNVINSFRTSDAQYPFEILLDNPNFSYREYEDVNELSNEELLKKSFKDILDNGYDILINDCTYTDFPSYHIIIPGLSEVGIVDDDYINLAQKRYNMQQAINNPSLINEQNCRYLEDYLANCSNTVLENYLQCLSGLYSTYDYPGKEFNIDVFYMLVMCKIIHKHYDEAANLMHEINTFVKDIYGKTLSKYKIIEEYLHGMVVLNNHDKVIKYLRYFFNNTLCNEINELFNDTEKVLIKQYPQIFADDNNDNFNMYCSQFKEYEKVILSFKKLQNEREIDFSKIKKSLDSVLN